MRRVMAQVDRVAASESRVCILGETGTGKEVVARTIHERSARRDRPFVTVNCAAVPSELIESELFGHEKGAFTGAAMRHTGKFEQAHGGTLFLDEIGDMPPLMQTKLLRVLQEGRSSGSGAGVPCWSTSASWSPRTAISPALVASGAFREDLFHRVFVFPLALPPLRERRGDIPALVEHFARLVAEQNGWKPRGFARTRSTRWRPTSWPGNVRELRNVVERLLLLSDGAVRAEDVRAVLPARAGAPPTTTEGSLADRVTAFERTVLAAELERHGYRIAEAARALGLERSHFYKKCQALGLDLKAARARHHTDAP